jgi:hypothetical protein
MLPLRRYFLIAAILVSLPALCQRGGHRGAARQGQTNPSNPDQDLLPSFTGAIHAIDPKLITLEEPGANLLEFRCSKKTRYYDGPKRIAASNFKPGDRVSIEARRELDGSLDAVNVRRDRPKPPQ